MLLLGGNAVARPHHPVRIHHARTHHAAFDTHAVRHSRGARRLGDHRLARHALTRQFAIGPRGGLTTLVVAGHRITVAMSAAPRFQGFIAALEQRGHIREIRCYSATGHVANSKHHWGGACDFDQRARNVAAPLMYHVRSLAHQFGLTDGCEWRHPDCGHIEMQGTTRIIYKRRARRV